jgi:putative drug exporter of the RND superfamily
VIVAVGAPDRLVVAAATVDASDEASTGSAQPDLVIATRGVGSARSGPYRVALRVISAQLSSDAAVSSVRRGPVSRDGRSTSLIVSLVPGDDTEDQRAVERIEAEIDPGPLRVAYGGQIPAFLEARHDLSRDLWKLEAVVAAALVLVLVAALGPWLAIAPVLCTAVAIAGALAGLRLADAFSELSLVGIAPAAVVGLALGVEVPCLMLARFGDEAASVSHAEAVRRSVAAAGEGAVPLILAATLATAGVLATGLAQAPSMILATGLAAGLAVGTALICVPALLALAGPRSGSRLGTASGEPRLAAVPRILAGFLARSRVRTILAAAIAVALMAAAALPMLHAGSRPFSAADLPRGSEAARATALAGGQPDAGPGGRHASRASAAATGGDRSLFEKLPLAAAISAGALALLLGIAFSPRVVGVAIIALLPVAAACGLCVLVFQDGHLAGAIGQRRQGALETGAAASLLVGLASVCGARAVTAIRAARAERSFGFGPLRAAEAAAAFTVPAAILATLAAAGATGALAGSDLYPVRELGLAVAAGLILDLVAVRVPLIAALSRWGGADG